MNIPSSFRITTLGLVTALGLSFNTLAQSPPPAPPGMPPAPAASTQLSVVTQFSRIRAFNAGPGGEVLSLYLQNGSVVDLTPALGGQLGAVVRKGEKITVTGTKSEINGQSLLEAASLRLNGQTFSANMPSAAAPSSGALAKGPVPPPPGTLQAPPPAPSSRRKNKAAAPAPCSVPADAPDEMAPPPPPPNGMAPPPPPQE